MVCVIKIVADTLIVYGGLVFCKTPSGGTPTVIPVLTTVTVTKSLLSNSRKLITIDTLPPDADASKNTPAGLSASTNVRAPLIVTSISFNVTKMLPSAKLSKSSNVAVKNDVNTCGK